MKISGVRQFRQHAAEYLSGPDPVLITRHGRISGLYLPETVLRTIFPDVNRRLIPGRFNDEIRALVDTQRDRCLWFLRRDYYPETPDDILRVLDAVCRHGDLAAFQKAKELKQWLSHPI
ncbi:MAG TPA: hypothetical protein PLV45_12840, partial [bacterium]|nr:hypothetical protein [bacterium]